MQSKNKSWILINKKNLIHNLQIFKKYSDGNVKVAAVVKANAYGHGLAETVEILEKETDFFIVDNKNEALAVRNKIRNAKILVIGFTEPEDAPLFIQKKISISIFDKSFLYKIAKLNVKGQLKIHIKIETGLNRLGFNFSELEEAVKIIKNNKNTFDLEGIYTHLANVEDTKDPNFTYNQIDKFEKAIDFIKNEGFKPRFIHAEATGAALLYPKFRYTMIRAGIGIYGLWPSEENKREILKNNKKIDLKPVLTWKSVVVQIKYLKSGDSVGYGRTWIAKRKTAIAIIPVGYSDGYGRGLSNKGRVIINGKYRNVVGRIAMNMFMVDVGLSNDVKIGDFVTLIGTDGECEVSADEIAKKIDTINYEIVSRINSNLPRIIK